MKRFLIASIFLVGMFVSNASALITEYASSTAGKLEALKDLSTKAEQSANDAKSALEDIKSASSAEAKCEAYARVEKHCKEANEAKYDAEEKCKEIEEDDEHDDHDANKEDDDHDDHDANKEESEEYLKKCKESAEKSDEHLEEAKACFNHGDRQSCSQSAKKKGCDYERGMMHKGGKHE